MSNSKSQAPPASVAFTEVKLYQAFIFSLPVFFTFILLLLFYFFYLRHRSPNWASLQMPTSLLDTNPIIRAELGLKKELREMLPVIIYKESFFVRDPQCPVCLGDYQAEDRLQQIPACGHTFHMDCLDHWLANHTTCPLCRFSLLASAKVASELTNAEVEVGPDASAAGNEGEPPQEPRLASDESQSTQVSEFRNEEPLAIHNLVEKEKSRLEHVNGGDSIHRCQD